MKTYLLQQLRLHSDMPKEDQQGQGQKAGDKFIAAAHSKGGTQEGGEIIPQKSL